MAKSRRRPYQKPRVARISFGTDGRIHILEKKLRDLVRARLRSGDNYLVLQSAPQPAPYVVEKAICGFPPPHSNIICPCDPGEVLHLKYKPK